MRRSHPRRKRHHEDETGLGDEALLVVQEDTRRGYRGPVLEVILPRAREEFDSRLDWERSTADWDDLKWAWFVFKGRFAWQRFLNWWVARRYVSPRDLRKR